MGNLQHQNADKKSSSAANRSASDVHTQATLYDFASKILRSDYYNPIYGVTGYAAVPHLKPLRNSLNDLYKGSVGYDGKNDIDPGKRLTLLASGYSGIKSELNKLSTEKRDYIASLYEKKHKAVSAMHSSEEAEELLDQSVLTEEGVVITQSKDHASLLRMTLRGMNTLNGLLPVLGGVIGANNPSLNKKLSSAETMVVASIDSLKKNQKSLLEGKVDELKEDFEKNKDNLNYVPATFASSYKSVKESTEKVIDVLNLALPANTADQKASKEALGVLRKKIVSINDAAFEDKDVSSMVGVIKHVGNILKFVDPNTSGEDRAKLMFDTAKDIFEEAAPGSKPYLGALALVIDNKDYLDWDKKTADERADMIFETGKGAAELGVSLASDAVKAWELEAAAQGLTMEAMATAMPYGQFVMAVAHWGTPVTIAATIAWKMTKTVLTEMAKMNKGIYTYLVQKDLEKIKTNANSIYKASVTLSKVSQLIDMLPQDDHRIGGLQHIYSAQLGIVLSNLVSILGRNYGSKGLAIELDFVKEEFLDQLKGIKDLSSDTNSADIRRASELVLDRLKYINSETVITKIAGYDFRTKKQGERKEKRLKENKTKQQEMLDDYGTLDQEKAKQREEELDSFHNSMSRQRSKISEVNNIVSNAEMGRNAFDVEYDMMRSQNPEKDAYIFGSEEYEIAANKEIADYLIENPDKLHEAKAGLEVRQAQLEYTKDQFLVYLAIHRLESEINRLPEDDKYYVQFLIETPSELKAARKAVNL